MFHSQFQRYLETIATQSVAAPECVQLLWAHPAHWATASEVATLKLMMNDLGILAAKLLAWSSEYMSMEKPEGVTAIGWRLRWESWEITYDLCIFLPLLGNNENPSRLATIARPTAPKLYSAAI